MASLSPSSHSLGLAFAFALIIFDTHPSLHTQVSRPGANVPNILPNIHTFAHTHFSWEFPRILWNPCIPSPSAFQQHYLCILLGTVLSAGPAALHLRPQERLKDSGSQQCEGKEGAGKGNFTLLRLRLPLLWVRCGSLLLFLCFLHNPLSIFKWSMRLFLSPLFFRGLCCVFSHRDIYFLKWGSYVHIAATYARLYTWWLCEPTNWIIRCMFL